MRCRRATRRSCGCARARRCPLWSTRTRIGLSCQRVARSGMSRAGTSRPPPLPRDAPRRRPPTLTSLVGGRRRRRRRRPRPRQRQRRRPQVSGRRFDGAPAAMYAVMYQRQQHLAHTVIAGLHVVATSRSPIEYRTARARAPARVTTPSLTRRLKWRRWGNTYPYRQRRQRRRTRGAPRAARNVRRRVPHQREALRPHCEPPTAHNSCTLSPSHRTKMHTTPSRHSQVPTTCNAEEPIAST